MKSCAIIGSNGFIGRHLEWYLNNLGIVPECYDITPAGKSIKYQKVDLTKREEVALMNFNVDYIFFFAGLTGTYIGFEQYEKYIFANEIALLNVLDAIKQSPFRPKIIFPSSRLVYKGKEYALKESDEQDSKTIYAANKIASENYLKAYSYSFDIPFSIFRICVPYGNVLDNNYSFGTIGFFIKMGEQKKDITLYGGGTYKRTFTHIKDLCGQIVKAAFKEQSDNQIYNIGGETYAIREVAELIGNKYGVNVVETPWPLPDLRIESGSTYFDSSKIENLLGEYEYIRLKESII